MLKIQIGIWLKCLLYLLCVILPIIILVMEGKKIQLSEIVFVNMIKWKINHKNEKEAKKYLLKLITKNPKSYYGHKMLAEIYENEGKFEQAIEEYIRATEQKQGEYPIYCKVSNLFHKIGKNEEAIKMLKHVLYNKPDNYEATNLLGEILQEEGSYKEAISIYLDALEYNPTNYDLYYNLGMTYTMMNDFQKAKEYYEKAATLNQLLYRAQLNLGQISMLYGDLEEAETFFMNSLKGKETECGSYYYLSLISMLKGEQEKAIQYMNVAIEGEPELYDKIQEETVFLAIRKKVKRANNIDNKNINISKKEKKVEKHLEETYYLVGNLNNIDLKAMQNLKQKRKQKEDKEKEL